LTNLRGILYPGTLASNIGAVIGLMKDLSGFGLYSSLDTTTIQ
jgi:hypothetical protein